MATGKANKSNYHDTIICRLLIWRGSTIIQNHASRSYAPSARAAFAGTHRHPRRRDGHQHPDLQAGRSRLPGRAVRQPPPRSQRQQRPALHHASTGGGRRTRGVSPGPGRTSSRRTPSMPPCSRRRITTWSRWLTNSNLAAAGCARRAARRVEEQDGKRRFVAGAIGPLSKTLSISRDVNDPGARDVTFDQVARRLHRADHRAAGGRRGTCCSWKRSSTRSTPRPRCSPSRSISTNTRPAACRSWCRAPSRT